MNLKPSRKSKKTKKRAYTSPLREEQAALTRDKILEGALKVLGSGDGDLSVPELARRTGISTPTIYRYFPTRADLLAGIVTHVDDQAPRPTLDPERASPEELIHAFFEHRAAVAAKLGSVGDNAAIWQLRKEVTVPARRAFMDRWVQDWAPDLAEPERTWLSDVLVVLISATSEVAFRNYLGLNASETAERVTWVVDALRAHAKKPSTNRPRK